MRRRFVATLPLYRGDPDAGLDCPTQVVKVEALVYPSVDGSEWEVGPVDCVEWLDERELEEAKDILAGVAQRESFR